MPSVDIVMHDETEEVPQEARGLVRFQFLFLRGFQAFRAGEFWSFGAEAIVAFDDQTDARRKAR